ncbi:hypothetical protein LCGC14_0968940 [marine sediment metagenome]|uniref:Homeodomain phBC6A51-type domain-containing protein n=1 Tax=marine sediment metagenome TaxID=412755 RepID=A0A0F9RIK6_9ZZZZ
MEGSPDKDTHIDPTRPQLGADRTPAGLALRLGFMDTFLADFRLNGNLTLACRAANVSRTTVYTWARDDVEGFAAAFAEAEQEACDRIEAEILRRGVEGWNEPVFYKGEETGKIRKYSDILLIFLAKARMPAKYRDRFEGMNLNLGDTLNVGNLSVGQRNNIISAIAALSEEELERLVSRGKSDD